MQRHLDLIHKHAPDFAIHTARQIDLGQFNVVLCINDKWIFRFPKSPTVAGEVAREIAYLRKLQGRLPLPIPDPLHIAYHEDKSLAYMGYKMLDGDPLLRGRFATLTDKKIREQLANDLVNFLKVLHSIPPKSVLDHARVDDSHATWSQWYVDFKDKLYPFMRSDAQEAVSASFEKALADESLWQFEPVLIHGDFGTGNILYKNGHIVGVIDWTFLEWGDPAQDLGALLSSYGEDFVKLVIERYPALEIALARARFYRSHYALIQAFYALRDNDKAEFDDGIQDYI